MNKKKTEVCVFHQHDSRIKDVNLGNEKVGVMKRIKIVGLIFDSKLNWYSRAMCAIEKANKTNQNCDYFQDTFLLMKC